MMRVDRHGKRRHPSDAEDGRIRRTQTLDAGQREDVSGRLSICCAAKQKSARGLVQFADLRRWSVMQLAAQAVPFLLLVFEVLHADDDPDLAP